MITHNIQALIFSHKGLVVEYHRPPLQAHLKLYNGIVMWFTGLCDKNGTEIFEGDVVEYDDGDIAKVIFKDGSFCGYDGRAASSDEAYTLLMPVENPYGEIEFELEVIGNIHENPELINP